MVQNNLNQLFERDLNKLKQEISSYKNEADCWIIQGGISNSAGNLCLHLVGNLKHFIGKMLGSSSYERQRDKEFSEKNIPSAELIHSIDQTIIIIKQTLDNLGDDDLKKIFPSNVFGYEMTTEYFLLHLLAHLNYHLGQVNYHRRLLNR